MRSAKERPEFLERFERDHGRALRVLHVGNIANNAYNNACIQRKFGIEADVLCPDYYHVMACPEWEDGNFSGSVGDDFFPDWWAVNLRGFRRPRWFAQGPLDACVRYLLAYRANGSHQALLWRWMQLERWMLCRRSTLSAWLRSLLARATGRPIRYRWETLTGIYARLWSLVNRRTARQLFRSAYWSRDDRRFEQSFAKYVVALLRRCPGADRHLRAANAVQLRDFFAGAWHPYLRLLFSEYDVIHAYATYTLMPFFLRRPYLAYEHGTLRNLPFQDTPEGWLCAITYRQASHVFITNSDNLDAAERLGLPADRLTCLPHAFDEDKLLRFAARVPTKPATKPWRFFSPARHDWVDGDAGWAKGNDRVLRALRKVIDSGEDCRLRLIAWGRHLEASKKLIEDLGLQGHAEWLPMLNKRQLWREYLQSIAVLDQFVVASMGGVVFEAMTLGRRVITAIDRDRTAQFFGQPPPVHACATADEIAAAMRAILADPQDRQGRGLANQQWMRCFHSSERIVSLQADTYRKFLAPAGDPSRSC